MRHISLTDVTQKAILGYNMLLPRGWLCQTRRRENDHPESATGGLRMIVSEFLRNISPFSKRIEMIDNLCYVSSGERDG